MNSVKNQSGLTDIALNQDALDEAELEVLRASIRVKSIVTLPSFVGMILASIVITFFLWDRIPTVNIFLWHVPVVLGLGIRYWMTRKVLQNIAKLNHIELNQTNQKLYYSSVANEFLVGSGMWTIALYGPPNIELTVTAIICFFGIGVMTNLSSDYKTYSHAIPVLLGQPVLFWLFKGTEGLVVALPILILMLVSLRMIHFNSQTFKDSILIRYEKNQLLHQLEGAQKETANALQNTQKENKMKDFFMAAAGHDLRQPLFAIGLLNESMTIKNTDEKIQELLQKQQTSIASLAHLFDSLLDLSQFEQGKICSYPVSFNIKHLCLSLREEFQLACDKKGLEFSCDHMDQIVYSDFDLITRLIRNLFTNAVRYTSEGGISICGKTTDSGFKISIADTGSGIDEDKHQTIFEEFVQLDKGTNDKDVGVGMGLAIVKQITQLLDIELLLNSAPGEGSTFTFTLPLAAPGK